MSVSASDRRTPPPAEDPWMTRLEAADYLGVAPRTLDRYSQDGKVRTGHTPGGTRRWRRSWLDAANEGGELDG